MPHNHGTRIFSRIRHALHQVAKRHQHRVSGSSPNFVLDYDEAGCVIGIEIEDASRSIDLLKLEISALPLIDLVMKQPQVSASATHA